MNFKLLTPKSGLPPGYTVTTWINADNKTCYNLFWGDDRLKSFSNKADACAYATEFEKQRHQHTHNGYCV
jgi:hypothetical protein